MNRYFFNRIRHKGEYIKNFCNNWFNTFHIACLDAIGIVTVHNQNNKKYPLGLLLLMVVEVREKFWKKTWHIKKIEEANKYKFRGQRNVWYYDRSLSNKKKPYNLK